MNTSVNENSKKKTKKLGRFNFIDCILIIIFLLVIATVFYVFTPYSAIKKLASNQTREIQYTVEISGVDEKFINMIKENDLAVDAVSKNSLGTVVRVEYSKYTQLNYVPSENSETEGVLVEGVLSEYPNKHNITITISATADYEAGIGYSVNNRRIAVGEKISLRFPDYSGEGYCSLISY